MEAAVDRVPYRIGLTGNIATGKSTVARMLAALGAIHLDADRVVHEVLAPGSAVYAAVVVAFGAEILTPEGPIDRRRLGAQVFNDPEALAKLESLVHPAVIAEIDRRTALLEAPVVVVEAIKLIESGMASCYHALWVTTCPGEIQALRLMQERGLTHEEAWDRIQAQPPQAEKLALADVVIDTGGTLAETQRQVVAAWEAISLGHLDSVGSED